MKYKTGDKVRVRPDLIGEKYYPYPDQEYNPLFFNPKMEKYCGHVYEIARIYGSDIGENNDYVLTIEEGDEWIFNNAMLMPVNSLGDLICRRENIK